MKDWGDVGLADHSSMPTCDEAFAILIHCYAGCTALENVVPTKTEQDKGETG